MLNAMAIIGLGVIGRYSVMAVQIAVNEIKEIAKDLKEQELQERNSGKAYKAKNNGITYEVR